MGHERFTELKRKACTFSSLRANQTESNSIGNKLKKKITQNKVMQNFPFCLPRHWKVVMRHKGKPHRFRFQSSFWWSQGVQQLLIFNVQSFWPSCQDHIKLFQRCLGSHQTSGRFRSIFQVGIGTSSARETSYLVIAWGSKLEAAKQIDYRNNT